MTKTAQGYYLDIQQWWEKTFADEPSVTEGYERVKAQTDEIYGGDTGGEGEPYFNLSDKLDSLSTEQRAAIFEFQNKTMANILHDAHSKFADPVLSTLIPTEILIQNLLASANTYNVIFKRVVSLLADGK